MIKIVVVALKPDSIQPGDQIVSTPIPQPEEGKEVLLKSEMKTEKTEESGSSSTVGL